MGTCGYLARRISNPTYRSEILYRVVDNQSYGSQTIVNEFPAPTDSRSRSFRSARVFDGLPDRILEDAARVALLIERPVWRDRGLVADHSGRRRVPSSSAAACRSPD